MKKSSSKSYYPSRLSHDKRGAMTTWIVAIVLILVVFFVGRSILSRESVNPAHISEQELKDRYSGDLTNIKSAAAQLEKNPIYIKSDKTINREALFAHLDASYPSQVIPASTKAKGFFSSMGDFFSGIFSLLGYAEIPWWMHIINIVSIALASILIALLIYLYNKIVASMPSGTPLALPPEWRTIAALVFLIILFIYGLLVLVPPFQAFKPLLGTVFSDYGLKLTTSYEGLIKPITQVVGKQAVNYSPWSLSLLWEYVKLPFAKGFGTAVYGFLFFLMYHLSDLIVKLIRKLIHLFYGVKAQIHLEKLEIGMREAIMGAKIQRETARAAAKD